MADGYLRVKNLEKYQHYKDRCPPWIKLHRDILRDYEFSCLQDASKLHLIMIWVLASQTDNRVPNDAQWIQQQIGAKSRVDLKSLIEHGFLIVEQDASKVLAECEHVAIAETEKEAEIETETEPPLPPAGDLYDFEAFWDAYPKGRKVGKHAALKAWRKIKPSQSLMNHIVIAITEQASNGHFKGSRGEDFIPLPATWLNQGRWKDGPRETSEDRQLRESHEETRQIAEKLGLAK